MRLTAFLAPRKCQGYTYGKESALALGKNMTKFYKENSASGIYYIHQSVVWNTSVKTLLFTQLWLWEFRQNVTNANLPNIFDWHTHSGYEYHIPASLKNCRNLIIISHDLMAPIYAGANDMIIGFEDICSLFYAKPFSIQNMIYQYHPITQ